ncbi:RHS repeat domain-containing protein [Aquimarina brevivitae]|uniref:RHS repeat-associated protein n=1 Tax=Aquimarina brevivitae TaxID=323412 RepID=A0A4Q7PIB9_9FLAO|nr:RHS repeat-associated core domain-containing protein [Aquimarina brevivitae]RZS99560.1 RHS repeat-associated protein [Aquimarina brevivitae]
MKKAIYFNIIILILSYLNCVGQIIPKYGYDNNGNLSYDQNKEIESIAYNVLNLPEAINFNDGRKIVFSYNASGEKIQQSVYDSNGNLVQQYNYIGGIVYENQNLSFIAQQEGYIEPNDDQTFLYTYQHFDHLGNIRLSYSDADKDGLIDQVVNGTDKDGDGDFYNEVKETKDYYPFGLVYKRDNVVRGRKHPYGFGKKEELEMFGLDWQDFGARMYEASLGRWHVIDPLAEKYYAISPNVYVANNPLNFIDPTGAKIEDPDGIVKRQKNFHESNIEGIKEALKVVEDKKMKKAFKGLLNANKSMLDKIEQLEVSEQTYRVSTINDNGVGYNVINNKVDIGIDGNLSNDDFIAMVAHELEHAHQYETGQISLRTDGFAEALNDIGDETNAFNQERIFGLGARFFLNKTEEEYTDAKTRGEGVNYRALPKGPISINSPQGRALRRRTIEAGRTGQPTKEYYKGWQADRALGFLGRTYTTSPFSN